MKVQITGASGFVGQYLCKHLSAELIPVKINSSDDFVVDATILIHLAGIAHNKKGTIASQEYHRVNTDLTKKAFDAFLSSSAQKLIVLSSVKAVAVDYVGVIDEENPEHPNSDYGKSKLAADNYMMSKELPEGKSVYILRPALISGPEVKSNLRSLYNFAKTPLSWIFAGVHNKRSYCNVSNLSFVIQQLIDRDDIAPGIYLVADDEPLSTSAVIGILSGKTCSNRILLAFASVIIKSCLSVGKYTGADFIVDPLRKLCDDYLISNNKITQAIGQRLPYSSAEGIRSIK
jgi:nucleoside-diphosphate-sugar epimerase